MIKYRSYKNLPLSLRRSTARAAISEINQALARPSLTDSEREGLLKRLDTYKKWVSSEEVSETKSEVEGENG